MPIIKRETSRGFSASDFANIIVTNTAAETTLFTIPIPAGALGTVKELSFKAICTITTGIINPTLSISVQFGAGTLTALSSANLSTSVTAQPLIIEGMIIAQGSMNAQFAWLKISPTSALPLSLNTAGGSAIADWAIDGTTSQTFAIKAKFGTALTSTTLVFKHATVEIS